MADPFIGEIRLFGFNYAPEGWLLCYGQAVATTQYQALYAVIGNTYGGNYSAFNLPDLRSRCLVGAGQAPGLSAYDLGEKGGTEQVTLLLTQIPPHNHAIKRKGVKLVADKSNAPASDAYFGRLEVPVSGVPTGVPMFAARAPDSAFQLGTIGNGGGGQAHGNTQPYLVMNFCIAWMGVFPAPG